MAAFSLTFADAIVRNIACWHDQLAPFSEARVPALGLERPNILRAVQFGLGRPETRPLAAHLLYAAYLLVERGGQWDAWLALYKQCGSDDRLEDRPLRLQLFNRWGQLLRLGGRLTDALETHRQARQAAAAAELVLETAIADFNLGEDYRLLEQYEPARRHAEAAATVFRQLPGATRWLAAAVNTLGLVTCAQGDYAPAIARLEEAVAWWRELDVPTELGRTLNNLGLARQTAGQTEEARDSFEQAVAVLASTASELEKSRAWSNLGVLHFSQGRLGLAEQAFQAADTGALRQSGDFLLQAAVAQNRGNVLVRQGQGAAAESHLQRACLWWEMLGKNEMLANSIGTLAEAYELEERWEEADALYTRALTLLAVIPDSAMARRLEVEFRAGQARLRH